METHKEDMKNMASYVEENKKSKNGKGTLRDKQGGKKKKWMRDEEKDATPAPEEDDTVIIEDL